MRGVQSTTCGRRYWNLRGQADAPFLAHEVQHPGVRARAPQWVRHFERHRLALVEYVHQLGVWMGQQEELHDRD